MNLRDYYTQTQFKVVTGLDHRQKIKRWLRIAREEGYTVEVVYICRKAFYNRHDVDSTLLQQNGNDPMFKWELAKRQFSQRRYDIDLNEWLPACVVFETFPYTKPVLWYNTKRRQSFTKVRTQEIVVGGTPMLLFYKPDVIALGRLRDANFTI